MARVLRSLLAFLTGLPVALLGGLIGLGGAEFRLPLLVSVFGYTVRGAIPLNLAVSLVTLFASLLIRLRTTPLAALAEHLDAIVSLLVGATLGAYLGTALARRVDDHALERVVFALLLGVGALLVFEAVVPFASTSRTLSLWASVPLGLGLGAGIGVFSSLLGVAGGELLIPTLLLVFGLDVRLAGTASVLISLPTVLTGLLRYRRHGAFERRADVTGVVAPMAAGSVIGAVLGGSLLAFAPTTLLKLGLGSILLLSAARALGHLRRASGPT